MSCREVFGARRPYLFALAAALAAIASLQGAQLSAPRNLRVVDPSAPPVTPGTTRVLVQSDVQFLGGFKIAEDFRLDSGATFRRKPDGTRTILLGPNAREFVIPATLGTGAWSSWPVISGTRNFVNWNGKNTISIEGQTPTTQYPNGIFWDAIGNRLYASMGLGQDDYTFGPGVGQATTIAVADVNTATDTATGTANYALQGVGFKRVSGCIVAVPPAYAQAYLGGRRLAAGCGGYRSLISYGQVSLGPALRAFSPSTAASGSALPSSEVLHFPDENGKRAKRPSTGLYSYLADTSVSADNTGAYQWTDQMLQGAVWVETSTVRGLVVLPWLGLGSMTYVQTGQFAQTARLAFQVFDPQTFAPVTGGNPWSPQPTSWWNPSFPGMLDPNAFDSNGQFVYTPSLTWDPTDRRLYVALTAPGPPQWPSSVKTVYIYQLP